MKKATKATSVRFSELDYQKLMKIYEHLQKKFTDQSEIFENKLSRNDSIVFSINVVYEQLVQNGAIEPIEEE